MKPQDHELKCWPQFWEGIESGHKSFDIREDDRGIGLGDIILFREWAPPGSERIVGYTGRECRKLVTYAMRHAERWGVRDGYVVLALCAEGASDEVRRDERKVIADFLKRALVEQLQLAPQLCKGNEIMMRAQLTIAEGCSILVLAVRDGVYRWTQAEQKEWLAAHLLLWLL